MNAPKLDALVLAGDRQGYMPVGRRNKARIELGGRRLIEYVVEALEESSLVRDIYVIGPAGRLQFLSPMEGRKKNVTLLDQRENIVENVVYAYNRICPKHNAPILVVTCDIPFVTGGEIDFFISRSEYENYDMVMGFNSEKALEPFYPEGGRPGIRLAYSYFSEAVGRMSNLFIVNPSATAHPEYAGIVYSFRYQKKLRNYTRLLREIIRNDVPKCGLLRYTLMLQSELQAEKLGFYGLAHRIGKFLSLRKVEEIVSAALGIRFKTFFMDFGAGAVDVDNETSLKAAEARFVQWRELSRKNAAEYIKGSPASR